MSVVDQSGLATAIGGLTRSLTTLMKTGDNREIFVSRER
jgi:hypothetical protein